MQTHDHKRLLSHLVERSRPIDDVLADLSEFDFDSDPLVALTSQHLLDLLTDYLSGNIDKAHVERWADAVEVRDDLYYEPKDEKVIKDIVFDLANPLLSGPLTPEVAMRMISALNARP